MKFGFGQKPSGLGSKGALRVGTEIVLVANQVEPGDAGEGGNYRKTVGERHESFDANATADAKRHDKGGGLVEEWSDRLEIAVVVNAFLTEKL